MTGQESVNSLTVFIRVPYFYLYKIIQRQLQQVIVIKNRIFAKVGIWAYSTGSCCPCVNVHIVSVQILYLYTYYPCNFYFIKPLVIETLYASKKLNVQESRSECYQVFPADTATA